MLERNFTKSLLPAEIILLFGILVAFGFNLLLGYKFLLPEEISGDLAQNFSDIFNYFRYFVLASTILVLVKVMKMVGAKKYTAKAALSLVVGYARIIICYTFALYLMMTFKWWAHLDGFNWDDWLMDTDEALNIDVLLASIGNIANVPQMLYMKIFALHFIIAYLVSASVYPQYFEKMLTGGVFVAVIGGLAYMVFPSYGPLVFAYSTDPQLGESQEVMKTITEQYRQSGGAEFDVRYFGAVLGAMPSLHVAHTVLISIYIYSANKYLASVFLISNLFIALYAMVTRFHYALDIVAGIIIAIVAYYTVEALYQRFKRIYS